MRLVVDHQNVLHAHQLGHDALEHLPLGFLGREWLTMALEKRPSALREFHSLPQFEAVVIGDDDLGAVNVGEHIRRDEFAGLVVRVGIVGLENPQAVADGKARGNNQESARELLAAGPAARR